MKLPNALLHAAQFHISLIVCLALPLAGCINFFPSGPFTISYVVCPPAGCLPTVPINIEDKSVFIPSLKAGINLDDGSQTATEPHDGHAIEFGLMSAKGSGNQSIASGQQVYLNTQFAGPQQIHSDFDFEFSDLMYRWRKFYFENSLGIEFLGGLGYSSLNLKVSSPTQSASGDFSDPGLQGGAGMVWRLRPGTSLQARATLLDRGNGSGVSNITRRELSFAQALSKNLTLHAGYASWKVNGISNETSGIDATPSEFHLRFSGPTLRLDWDINTRNSSAPN